MFYPRGGTAVGERGGQPPAAQHAERVAGTGRPGRKATAAGSGAALSLVIGGGARSRRGRGWMAKAGLQRSGTGPAPLHPLQHSTPADPCCHSCTGPLLRRRPAGALPPGHHLPRLPAALLPVLELCGAPGQLVRAAWVVVHLCVWRRGVVYCVRSEGGGGGGGDDRSEPQALLLTTPPLTPTPPTPTPTPIRLQGLHSAAVRPAREAPGPPARHPGGALPQGGERAVLLGSLKVKAGCPLGAV